MPNWKKVIVSGSDASLNSLNVNTSVTASSFSGNFTGSLQGTASWAINALTASYVLGQIADSGYVHSQSLSSATWSIQHNLNTLTPLVNVYDSNYFQVIPTEIVSISTNIIEVRFELSASGYAIVSKGSGVTQTTISASYAVVAGSTISASYATTASYLEGAISNAVNAETASKVNGGTATYIPLWLNNNQLTSSFIVQSGSTVVINATSSPTPSAPEVLAVIAKSGSESYNVISGYTTVNNYAQLNIKNLSSGVSASSDVVATANNGTETSLYIDMGINGSNYINNGNGVGATNDAYLYSTGNDLLIGNATPGKKVIIFNGGLDSNANARLFLDSSGSFGVNTSEITTNNPESLFVRALNTDTYNLITAKANVNNYSQINLQNENTGNGASADIVATADNGNETINYIDMGINGSGYTGVVGGANDGYVYTTGNHLHLGTATAGQYVGIFAGGLSSDDNNKLIIHSNNQHRLTGSLHITGSLIVSGSVVNDLTASWAINARTASYVLNAVSASQAQNAITASYVLNAISASFSTFSQNASTASFVQTAQTASYVLNAISASFVQIAQTASYVLNAVSASQAQNAVTASFAITASYAMNAGSSGLQSKAGSVDNTSFIGTPRKATVTFSTPFSNNNYAISVTGEDARSWTIESKVSGSFIINTNSNTTLTGTTFWIATAFGES